LGDIGKAERQRLTAERQRKQRERQQEALTGATSEDKTGGKRWHDRRYSFRGMT
jgi:hypothetical protein